MNEWELATKLATLAPEQIEAFDYSKMPFKIFWMHSGVFRETYGLARSNITLFRQKHPELEGAAWKKDEDGVKLNNQFFTYYHELRERIWKINHELFYAMGDVGFGASDLARFLAKRTGRPERSWVMYIYKEMWALPAISPMMYQIPARALQFLIYVSKMYFDINEGGLNECYEHFKRTGRAVRKIQQQCEADGFVERVAS